MGVSSVCVEEGERRSEEELGARSRSVGRSVGRSSVSRSAPKRARAPSRASSAAPASRNEPRGSQVLRLAASRGGAPKRARAPSRASSAAPASRNEPRGSQVLRLAGPRNALGHRPEPEVLPLPAEASREAPKCCAWQHEGGAPKRARAPSRASERVCVYCVCV